MKKGDLAFFYHSSADPTGVAGIVKIVREARPDETAFDPKDHHYDPKSNRDKPMWYGVDVKLERKLKRIVTLAELKAQKALQGMILLRPGNRLSVMPVETKHWDAVLEAGMSRTRTARHIVPQASDGRPGPGPLRRAAALRQGSRRGLRRRAARRARGLSRAGAHRARRRSLRTRRPPHSTTRSSRMERSGAALERANTFFHIWS